LRVEIVAADELAVLDATCPAMNRNSDALTRVMCEYCPSGFSNASGLRILMSGMARSFTWRLVQR